jgi:hypothetical protein
MDQKGASRESNHTPRPLALVQFFAQQLLCFRYVIRIDNSIRPIKNQGKKKSTNKIETIKPNAVSRKKMLCFTVV